MVPRPAYALGNFQHTLVVGGQVAGTWRIIPRAKKLAMDVRTLSRLTAAQRRGLVKAVARYRHFLGVPVSLSVT